MLLFSRGEMFLALCTLKNKTINLLKTKPIETGSGCTQESREGGQKQKKKNPTSVIYYTKLLTIWPQQTMFWELFFICRKIASLNIGLY